MDTAYIAMARLIAEKPEIVRDWMNDLLYRARRADPYIAPYLLATHWVNHVNKDRYARYSWVDKTYDVENAARDLWLILDYDKPVRTDWNADLAAFVVQYLNYDVLGWGSTYWPDIFWDYYSEA